MIAFFGDKVLAAASMSSDRCSVAHWPFWRSNLRSAEDWSEAAEECPE